MTSPSVSIQVGGEGTYTPRMSHLTTHKMKQISLKLFYFFFFLFLFSFVGQKGLAVTQHLTSDSSVPGGLTAVEDEPLNRAVYVSPASLKRSSHAGKSFGVRMSFPPWAGRGPSRPCSLQEQDCKLHSYATDPCMEAPFQNVQSLFASFPRGQSTAMGQEKHFVTVTLT